MGSVGPGHSPFMQEGSASRASHADIRIHYKVPFIGQCKNEPFDKLDGELAWMLGFFDVIMLYVWDHPNVARILAEGIA